jgi:hypothetical protein
MLAENSSPDRLSKEVYISAVGEFQLDFPVNKFNMLGFFEE